VKSTIFVFDKESFISVTKVIELNKSGFSDIDRK